MDSVMSDPENKPVDENLVDESRSVDPDESEVSATGATEGSEMTEKLLQLERERDDCHERWMRSQAELENYRRRANREMDEARKYQSLSLIRDLLPGLDNLRRALEAARKSSSIDELLTGVDMVMKQFDDTLARHSAQPIEALGQPFDPNLHEAIQQVPSAEHPPMTVIHELERGFVLNDRVIRPSKVVVSCAAPDASGPATEAAGQV